MKKNIVSAELNATDAQALVTAVDGIKKKLPFLIDLSPEDRRALPKMGDKSRAFVAKALEVASQNPDILPRNFSPEEFRKDVVLLDQLTPLALSLGQLAELVEDTVIAAGSDAYMAALVVYHSAKLAGQGAGMDAQLDNLGQRFARKLKNAASAAPAN